MKDGITQLRYVSKIIIHEGYSDVTKENDIALLQLTEPFTFNNYVRPVCLASSTNEVSVGTMCTVTGWGATKSMFFGHFLFVTVQVFRTKCRHVELTYGVIFDTLHVPLHHVLVIMTRKFPISSDHGLRDIGEFFSSLNYVKSHA